MFGIGGFELFLILLFGFLIFGPDKLPGIAKTIGKAISRFRNAQSRLNSSLNNEMFDKNSDEPFKNPLDTINRMADAAQTGGSQGAAGAASAGAAAMQASGNATGGAQKERAESFAERKARYDKERAARKAAEKQEGDAAAGAAGAAGATGAAGADDADGADAKAPRDGGTGATATDEPVAEADPKTDMPAKKVTAAEGAPATVDDKAGA